MLYYRFQKNGNLPNWFLLCAIAVINVFFGLYPVVVKAFASGSGEKPNAYVFTFYRDVAASPLLFFSSYVFEGEIKLPNTKATMTFAVLGFFGVFVGQMAYINGLYLVGPDLTSAMQPTVVVWTALLSILFCVEKIPSPLLLHSYAKLLGILSAVGGAAKLVLSGSSAGTSILQVSRQQQVMGCFSLLVDTLCVGVYLSLQKKLIFSSEDCVWRNSPIAVTAYSYLFGTIFMGLSISYYVLTQQYDQFLIPSHSVPALLYAIVVISTVGYSVVSWINKHIPASVIAAFWPVQYSLAVEEKWRTTSSVVATVSCAYLIFGDELTIEQYFAALLIFVGLALVLYSDYMDKKISNSPVEAKMQNHYCGHH